MKHFCFTTLFIILSFHLSSQHFNSEILQYETEISVSEKHLLTKKVSVVIQINNRGGEDLCDVSVPFSGLNPMTELEAHIEDLNGKIIKKLKKKDIIVKSSISDISLYEDDYIKSFVLLHNVYPYKLVYSYTHKYNNYAALTYWHPVIDFDYPTQFAQLKLSIPKDYKIIISSDNLEEPVKKEIENTLEYVWTANYDGNYTFEKLSPHFSHYLPYLKVLPLEFNLGVPGKHDSWSSFGKWMFDLNKGLDELSVSEKAKIDALINTDDKPKEKIRKLNKYMQNNTRYINVSIDIGGWKSYPAEYVCENKYGDCKALTNFMKSMLKYVGIKSYYSLVNAGANAREIDKTFPSNQFNHVILFIPLEKDTMWLECTSTYKPPGYLGTFTQGRYALVIKEEGGELLQTPTMNAEDVKIERKMIFNFSEESVNIDILFKFRAYSYERLMQFSNLYTEKEKREYIHKFIPFSNYEIKHWKIKKFKDQPCIELKLNIKKKKYLEKYEDMKFIGLYKSELLSLDKPKDRKKALLLKYPRYLSDSIIYSHIENYNVSPLKDTMINTEIGKFELKSRVIDNSLLVNKNLILYAGKYENDTYKALYDFLNSVKTIERKNPIIYTKK